MRACRAWIPLAAVALMPLTGGLCPLHALAMQELYDKAKAEGALSIYGRGPVRLYER
jgi:hypothetical protein